MSAQPDIEQRYDDLLHAAEKRLKGDFDELFCEVCEDEPRVTFEERKGLCRACLNLATPCGGDAA